MDQILPLNSNLFGSKICQDQIYFEPSFFTLYFLDSTFFLSHKLFGPKIFLWPHFFRQTFKQRFFTHYFLETNLFRNKLFWTQHFFMDNIFLPNTFLDTQFFSTQDFFEPEFLLDPNFLDPNYFSDLIQVWTQNKSESHYKSERKQYFCKK